MKESLHDPTLRVPESAFYYVCIPLRVCLALIFFAQIIPQKWFKWIALAFFFLACTFSLKAYRLPRVWKAYLKSITLYLMCAAVLLIPKIRPYASLLVGIFLTIDVATALVTRHVAEIISS